MQSGSAHTKASLKASLFSSLYLTVTRPETEAYTTHLAEFLVKAQAVFHEKSKTQQDSLKIIDFFGLDISSKALDLANQNVRFNGLKSSAQQSVRFEFADVLGDEKKVLETCGGACDVIISNPPYISEDGFNKETTRSVRNWEPKLALVPKGSKLDTMSSNDDLGNFPLVEAQDIFYHRLLHFHSLLKSKILLMEVGDEAQARRVVKLASRSPDRIEIWRDLPDQYEPENGRVNYMLIDGYKIMVKGTVGQGYRPAAFQGSINPGSVDTFFTLTAGTTRRKSDVPGLAPANPLRKGNVWYTNLTVEGQTYPLVIDTGSSDTWIVKPNFTCLDSGIGAPTSQGACLFGPGYAPGSGFKPIPNVHFNTTYPSGENLKGTFGFVEVNLGGITVNTQIATVDTAIWLGDGTTSGVLGLAYPSITASFNGTTFDSDNAETQLPYDPIFTTMYKQNLIPPIFSLALSRPSDRIGHESGYLALGGLPPIASYGPWGVAPIQYVEIGEGYLQGALPWPQNQVYTLTPDDFLYLGSQRRECNPKHRSPLSMPNCSSQVQLSIDSGTSLIFLPNSIASALGALYNPPAVYNHERSAYSVPCNASAPYFAVVIGGVRFPIDPRDMIQDDNTGTGGCVAGVNNGDPSNFYTLGDVFLKNVLVVFDVGASQLKFRSRGFY
ncbi:hypothetical protein DSL72_008324 [Monilinia vaccinii-corymbosi]|uniref:Peptidase A1 domain-containing protein n=1 Tax=Monilinia vaccinii-corymbosi TaxID=61207 RepID=A0A8A3PKF8_9HELO|nr:hypothetical protein DSL72_008324 [Monilinia vaccinii-corymbosi]